MFVFFVAVIFGMVSVFLYWFFFVFDFCYSLADDLKLLLERNVFVVYFFGSSNTSDTPATGMGQSTTILRDTRLDGFVDTGNILKAIYVERPP